MLFSLPPELPVSETVLVDFDLAVSSARIRLGELPLVEIPMATSHSLPKASN
jgi:hypothetical protein